MLRAHVMIGIVLLPEPLYRLLILSFLKLSSAVQPTEVCQGRTSYVAFDGLSRLRRIIVYRTRGPKYCFDLKWSAPGRSGALSHGVDKCFCQCHLARVDNAVRQPACHLHCPRGSSANINRDLVPLSEHTAHRFSVQFYFFPSHQLLEQHDCLFQLCNRYWL